MNRSNLVTGLLTITALAACATTDTAAPDDTPVARFVASDRTQAELGVTTWEVRPDGADDRVIGRDASSERVIEMILYRDPTAVEESIDVETVYPELETLRLTPAGVTSASSVEARRLGLDLSADLGRDAVRIDDGVGTSVSALSITDPRIQAEGIVHMPWSLFGAYQNIVVGGSCRQNTVRHHGEVYADYGAVGIWMGWAFPYGPATDCTAKFYLQVNGGHWDNFHWRIYNAPVNLAAGKSTSQSSTGFGGNAARAVDGSADGNWANNSVTHTNFEAQPWWQVDLGASVSIGGVVLFNRTDCCTDRLSDFDILTSDDGTEWRIVAGTTGPAANGQEYSMNTMGRFVRVQLRGSNFLSLAEVQVFAR